MPDGLEIPPEPQPRSQASRAPIGAGVLPRGYGGGIEQAPELDNLFDPHTRGYRRREVAP